MHEEMAAYDDAKTKLAEVLRIYWDRSQCSHVKPKHHMIYRMRNSPSSYCGFGGTLRFQERCGQQLAQHHDQHFPSAGQAQVSPIITLCSGSGKTALVSNGIKLLQTFAKNPVVEEAVDSNAAPLEIHFSFGKCSELSQKERKLSIALATNRRMVANYLGLSWEDGSQLHIDESLSVQECLVAIIEHHRSIRQLASSDCLFIYLAIDDFVKVSDAASVWTYDDVLQQIRQAVFPNCIVSVVLAGALTQPFHEACKRQSIEALEIRTPVFSNEQIEMILRYDVGLDEAYLQHASFRTLLHDLGPHLHLIGIAVSMLEFHFDPESIRASRKAVEEYVARITKSLSSAEANELLAVAICGLSISPFRSLTDDSQLTLEALEGLGLVLLVPSDKTTVSQAYLPRIVMDDVVQKHPLGGYYINATSDFLHIIDRLRDTVHFSMLLALYLGMKRHYLLQKSPTVTVDMLLPDPERGSPVSTHVQLLSGPCTSESSNSLLRWQGKPFPEFDSRTVRKHLSGGRIVVNTDEASINLIMAANVPTNEGPSCGLLSIFADFSALCINPPLTKDEVERRVSIAYEMVKRSSRCHLTMIPAVITNRPLAGDVCQLTTAGVSGGLNNDRMLVVGQPSMSQVLGPTVGRMVTSRWAPHTSIAKATYSTVKACWTLRSRMKLL